MKLRGKRVYSLADRFFMGYFSFQPVPHDWFNKDRDMFPLLLTGKSSLCGGSGFPLAPSASLPYV